MALLPWSAGAQAQPPEPVPNAVVVRHAPALNGRVEGSVQLLSAESLALNGGATLTGDLLVPGLPRVVVNGHPTYSGTLDGTGSAQPTSHTVTINGGASLRYLRRRTDAVPLPIVPVPPASTGTRSVVLNGPNGSAGDWSTVRDLTLNGNAGMIAVPPGTYRNFIANGGSGFVLGIAGATQASVYHFDQITLNGGAPLQVVGPVVVNAGSRVIAGGGSVVGAPAHPEWLALNIARFDLTLNGSAAFHGNVQAPAGAVTVNGGTLAGSVAADRVSLNGNGTIRYVPPPPPAPADTTPPVLDVVLPAEGSVADGTTVVVSGSVDDASPVGVQVEDGFAYRTGRSFVRQIDLPEGERTIRITAIDAFGNRTEVLRKITVDATPPILSELAPPEGTLVAAREVTVSGRVTDANATSVEVQGVAAEVGSGGAFVAAHVPLAEGENLLQVTATDIAGRTDTAELRLLGRDLTPPAAPVLFPVAPLTRETLLALEGRAEPGASVRVTGGADPGAVTAPASAGTGLFTAVVRLATGANTLTVATVDAGGNASPAVQVSVASDPAAPLPPAGSPAYLAIGTGDSQRGLIGGELPRPLITVVKDRDGAPLAGVPVVYRVLQGGGRFAEGGEGNAGPDTLVVASDAGGYARARYVSGGEPGPQLVRADFAGNLFAPVVFAAEAFAPRAGGRTSVSGVVRDVNSRALPNVLVRLGGQQTRTGQDGRFRIENPAAGPHQLLELIGRDQIPYPGRWPNISYDLDVVAGIDNHLGRPLYLPKVNGGTPLPLDDSGRVTEDTTVRIFVAGGQPPVEVTARAGTHVTFPPDATDRRLSVTRIPASRIPMVLEDGRATNLYISVQPSGALFDPPLAIRFPNLDGQAPGAQVLLMSFDHDAGRYVQVGEARVSAGGRTVESLPGSGIRVGAWHAAPPPLPGRQVTAVAELPVAGDAATASATGAGLTAKSVARGSLAGLHIDDILASVYGTSAIVITPRDGWHDTPLILFRASFYIPGNPPAPSVRYDVDVQTSQAQVTLATVTFKDNYKLKQDTGKQEDYPEPEFGEPKAGSKPAPPRPYAVAYKVGKKMKLEATFNLSTAVVKPKEELVKALAKADGNDDYDLLPAKLEYDNKAKVAKLKATFVKTPFAGDKIDLFDPMTLKWSVALDGSNYMEAGTSANPLYVTLTEPGQRYLTLIDMATRPAAGLKKGADDAIFAAIWDCFTSLEVKRMGDLALLQYWGPKATDNKYKLTEDNNTAGLLRLGDGRCGSWHLLLTDAVKVQGIDEAKPHTILPKLDPAAIPEPKVSYGPCDSGILVGHGYWVATDRVCGLQVHPAAVSKGQGGLPQPGSASFTDHAVVVYKGRIYDPSYGRDFDNLKQWEDGSLDFTSYRKKDGADSAGNPKYKDCRYLPNTSAAEETDLYDDRSVPPAQVCADLQP